KAATNSGPAITPQRRSARSPLHVPAFRRLVVGSSCSEGVMGSMLLNRRAQSIAGCPLRLAKPRAAATTVAGLVPIHRAVAHHVRLLTLPMRAGRTRHCLEHRSLPALLCRISHANRVITHLRRWRSSPDAGASDQTEPGIGSHPGDQALVERGKL